MNNKDSKEMIIEEFRKGNILHHNWLDKDGNTQGTIRIYGILGDFIYIDSNRLPKLEEIHIKDVNPLKANPTWLLKAGFKECIVDVKLKSKEKVKMYASPYFEKSEYWLEYMLPIKPFNHPFLWLCWDKGKGREYIPCPNGENVEYMHQIQNIFLDLSGKDLVFKKLKIIMES